MSSAVLHPVGAPVGSGLADAIGDGLRPLAPLRGRIGCFERIVADVTGPDALLADVAAELPVGPARSEALAVRLRRRGVPLTWGAPVPLDDRRALIAFCEARGRSSLEQTRADPSLIGELQLGAWFDARSATRAARRVALALGGRPPGLKSLTLAADVAFWTGVRAAATDAEWRRLTRSSYVVLVYHRFAGELKPGQERIDIAPRRFARQLRALRLAGFRPLAADGLLAFHAGAADSVPRRSVVISVDDALVDCVEPLRRHADWLPQLFVCTLELGGTAHWIAEEPVAGWDDVHALAAAGVEVGSHARHHRPLSTLSEDERADELCGSLADLREHLGGALEIVAYPNGVHDEDVCQAAREAGYSAAYTTEKGRNGGGRDPHALRRVSVHGHDGVAAVLWKAWTGEALPGWWPRLRARRLGSAR